MIRFPSIQLLAVTKHTGIRECSFLDLELKETDGLYTLVNYLMKVVILSTFTWMYFPPKNISVYMLFVCMCVYYTICSHDVNLG